MTLFGLMQKLGRKTDPAEMVGFYWLTGQLASPSKFVLSQPLLSHLASRCILEPPNCFSSSMLF